MNDYYVKNISCNLCGYSDFKVIERAEPPFCVVKCTKCGLAFTTPQPSRTFTEEHYSQAYYDKWLKEQLPKRIPMWKKRLRGIKKYRKEGRLLDVGFGLGTFLKVAKDSGFEACGTEISEYACGHAKNDLGIKVFNGTLKEAGFSDSQFDIVTLWHVLEHTPDPKDTLKEACRIMKKNGLLVVAVPNLNNLITRILYRLGRGKKLKIFSIKDKELHIYTFSTRTLVAMLEQTGFRVLKVDLDLAQITFPKKIIDWLAFIVYLASGKNFGEAIKAYAVKR